MAGAGYKLFNTGDVLTAQQVNEYLMQQTVMSFANAAARTTALSGVLAEGMVSYLQDTNVVEIYTGASWVSLDDPNAIQNSLLTTTGDTIYASGASTPARLGIGTTGQVLTVSAGGLPSWATASSGGMTLISTTTLSTASVVLSSIPSTYISLQLYIFGMTANTSNGRIRVLPNGVDNLTNANGINNNSLDYYTNSFIQLCYNSDHLRTNSSNVWNVTLENYASASSFKPFYASGFYVNSSSVNTVVTSFGAYRSTTAISSLTLDYGGTNTFAGGTALLYGVK